MKIIRRKSVLVSCGISLMYTSGVVAAFVALLTLALSGCHLTPFTVFTLLSIINVLRNSALRSIAEGAQFVYEAYVSFNRIQKFLSLPELQCLTSEEHPGDVVKGSLYRNKFFRKVPVDISEGFTYFDESIKRSCIMTKFVKLQDDKNGYHPIAGLANLGFYQTIIKGNRQPNTEAGIKMINVTCKLSGDEKVPLKSVNFEAKDKTLTIITGPVGSGKSSLLSAIAGEIPVIEGKIESGGSMAYVPQLPWVFSGTLRENVLFGLPFHYDRYIRAITACGLEEDLQRFPDRDQVVIGQRGNTLSGGQQTRVSLARAVYANCDIYLLDNPLAALDANVADYIFKHCILGILSDKVRLMVSHNDHHMNSADQVLVLDNGSLIADGKFLELCRDETFKDFLESQHIKEDSKAREIFSLEHQIKTSKEKSSEKSAMKSMKIPEEDRETGTVSFKLYWDYLRAGVHPLALAMLVILFLVSQGTRKDFDCLVNIDIFTSSPFNVNWTFRSALPSSVPPR